MSTKRIFSFALLLLAGTIIAACSTNSDSGKGTLKIGLTDAPANFEEVNIEVRQVLVNKDSDAEEPDGDSEIDDNDNDSRCRHNMNPPIPQRSEGAERPPHQRRKVSQPQHMKHW